jgi:hypothetical protein
MTPRKFDSPLDQIFDVDANEFDDTYDSAMPEQIVNEPSTALATQAAPEEKDAEDVEIDKKIDTVFEQAMGAYELQTSYLEVIEPRYAARNAEVAAQYLNIALQAANSRARVKTDRRRSGAFVPFNNQKSGTVVATHEEIMRMISVDADHKEVK